MHINGTACNLIKLAYCLHSKVHNFAQEGPLVISEHLTILEDFWHAPAHKGPGNLCFTTQTLKLPELARTVSQGLT